MKSLAYLCL